MTITTMRAVFADQWVAAKVHKTSKANIPLTGEIISHSPEKRTVYTAAETYRVHHPEARVFIFFTGDPIPEGVEAMLALC